VSVVLHYSLSDTNMVPEELHSRIGPGELKFSTSRSGGPGGQNVNKVNTKVELRFDLTGSCSLSEDEKNRIRSKLSLKISSDGFIIIVSQSERTQLMNRKKAVEKFFRLLASALTEKKPRKATRPSIASLEERLDQKKKRGVVKKLRKTPGTDT